MLLEMEKVMSLRKDKDWNLMNLEKLLWKMYLIFFFFIKKKEQIS